MYIKREIKMVITNEEREILKSARQILMDFENESSKTDDDALQEMYEKYIVYNYSTALPIAVDLLSTILGDNNL